MLLLFEFQLSSLLPQRGPKFEKIQKIVRHMICYIFNGAEFKYPLYCFDSIISHHSAVPQYVTQIQKKIPKFEWYTIWQAFDDAQLKYVPICTSFYPIRLVSSPLKPLHVGYFFKIFLKE